VGEFDDPRVELVRHAESRGTAAARNAGIARARGQLLAFLDDDDEWLPEKTAHQAELLLACGPEVAGVACAYDLWDDQRPLERVEPPTGDLRRALLENPCLAPSTVMLRREALEAAGGFDEDVYRCEDWELWLRLADEHTFVALPEALVRRRRQWLAPEQALAALEPMLARLAPRIDALPARERERVRAHHDLVLGIHHAQRGDRARARALIWSAWRRNPRSPRPLAHLLRTLTGERLWERLARGPGWRFRKDHPGAPHRARPSR
jgi:glycosyltransferase involved in cell wall biosynthesis